MSGRSHIGRWFAAKAREWQRLGARVALCGVQPMASADLNWEGARTLVIILAAAALAASCAHMLIAGARDRREAQDDDRRSTRRLQQLFREHGSRMDEVLAQGREGDGLDPDVQGRAITMLSDVRAGLTRLDQRIVDMEKQGAERRSQLVGRLEDAMMAMRNTGRATVRLLLDRCGLTRVLQDLCWSLEAPGTMRVALVTEGVGPDLKYDTQLALYHLVHDAVDSVMGYQGVGQLSVRLRRSERRTDLLLADDGGERLAHHPRSEAGWNRLKARIAAANGRIERRALPEGGHELHVRLSDGSAH